MVSPLTGLWSWVRCVPVLPHWATMFRPYRRLTGGFDLLVAQSLYGIEARGAAGRVHSGEQADHQRESDRADHQP